MNKDSNGAHRSTTTVVELLDAMRLSACDDGGSNVEALHGEEHSGVKEREREKLLRR